ncbi:MAG: hypothetical protein ABIB46_01545 [bacterium]
MKYLFIFIILSCVILGSCEKKVQEAELQISLPPKIEIKLEQKEKSFYNPISTKKDPFTPPIKEVGTLNLNLEQLKLVGIMQKSGKKCALVELKNDPIGYFLKEGDLIKDAKLVFIQKNKVVFEQILEDGKTIMKIELKLKKDNREAK